MNTCAATGIDPLYLASEWSVQGGQSKPIRSQPSGSFHQNSLKEAYLVDLTDINQDHRTQVSGVRPLTLAFKKEKAVVCIAGARELMLLVVGNDLSWDRMDAQEELDSYEETMCNNRGSGRRRVLTEFSEIGRIEGSMTELIGISRNKVLLQSSVGSVVPRVTGSAQKTLYMHGCAVCARNCENSWIA
ncbi:uncharacterized protein UBRO_20015 [Ustilago bromivora]|uniref:Uncharacterized protein n=1 Tax=Ustilago bromivora TaxID=307758 RepID=A0A1K0GM78_9BASI|nr:uncharacterized protein UBRO_20015 [Ustilago bromivora]